MFPAVSRTIAVILVYALVSGLAGWNAAEVATDYGAFGSCFEGGCAYGAIFLGFPAFWLLFFVLLFVTREWQLGWFSRDWRALVAALLIFPVVCALGFALILSGS